MKYTEKGLDVKLDSFALQSLSKTPKKRTGPQRAHPMATTDNGPDQRNKATVLTVTKSRNNHVNIATNTKCKWPVLSGRADDR